MLRIVAADKARARDKAARSPFTKVTLVKDDEEIHTTTPKTADVELTWTDPSPTVGKASYYYFRGEQADGELVWVSPMWITYRPNP